jgi:hypothetical protein
MVRLVMILMSAPLALPPVTPTLLARTLQEATPVLVKKVIRLPLIYLNHQVILEMVRLVQLEITVPPLSLNMAAAPRTLLANPPFLASSVLASQVNSLFS